MEGELLYYEKLFVFKTLQIEMGLLALSMIEMAQICIPCMVMHLKFDELSRRFYY